MSNVYHKTPNNAQCIITGGVASGATTLVLPTGQGSVFSAKGLPIRIALYAVTAGNNPALDSSNETVECTSFTGDTANLSGAVANTHTGSTYAAILDDGGNITELQTQKAEGYGANADITSLTGLTTPLSVPQGGTGAATLTGLVKGTGTTAMVAATAGTDYMSPANAQNHSATHGTDTGAADAYAITLSPAPSAYAAGQVFSFVAAHTNTTTSTLNVNALGVKTIKKTHGGANLAAGDITVGDFVIVGYDGTNFQLGKLA